MSAELTVLVLLALLQIVLWPIVGYAKVRQYGAAYAMGSRDEDTTIPPQIEVARGMRAYGNHQEWLLPFAIAAIVLHLTGQSTALTATCAWVYLAARIAYVPAYMLGLNPHRSIIWMIGLLATLIMLIAALI